jgi:hypothetical protein
MLDFQLNNPVTLEMINRFHREEIMEDAHRSRVLNEAGIRKPSLLDPVLMQIGGLLIALGLKLQARCLLAMPQSTKPHPSKY